MPQGWRTVVGVAWCGATLAYVTYASFTYTGLYAWAAELAQRWFGAYDPMLTFVVLLIGFWMPALQLAPASPRPTVPAVADPAASRRLVNRTVAVVAAVLLTVGIGAGSVALWRGSRTPIVAQLDLARGPGFPADADELVVVGQPQRGSRVVLTEIVRGSTIRTAYTPLTPPSWTPPQPIRFVMREALASAADALDSTPNASRTVRFGPAVLLRHALPGPVRVALNRGGRSTAPDVVVLDENLESAQFTLWIVAFFGCVLAVSLAVVSTLVARAQAGLRARAVLTATRPAAVVGRDPTPSRHWRLVLGGEHMADLRFESYETPWITASVEARPGLGPFLRYFGDAEAWPDDDPTIDEMVAEVRRRGGFRLFDDRGQEIVPFTLVNVDEAGANLRY